ncbi:MAG: hypothetical protein EA356_08340 [Geminicoccaceae bacterium]|nr:MAG: hypothetical protein EA356_08340 [Geminicoccaceae bacterium]
MTCHAPEPVPVLAPPVVRALHGGPVAGCFTVRDAAIAWDLLHYDAPPLVDLSTRLVVHFGLDLALPTGRQPIPLAVWLVQRAVLAFGEALSASPPDRARAFLDRLLEDSHERLPGLRIIAEEGAWQPLTTVPLPVFLDCRTVLSVRYAPPDPGEDAAIRRWLLAGLEPLLLHSWGIEP